MLATFHVRLVEFSLGSFGALCKISDVKIFKMLLPMGFIQFQPNSILRMVIGRKYSPFLVIDPPNF